MDIGGANCHFCGSEVLQTNLDTVFLKNGSYRYVVLYECGTEVCKSWKKSPSYDNEGSKKKYCEVTMGNHCVHK